MTDTERKALITEAKRSMEQQENGLTPENWVLLLNCYTGHVRAEKCADLLQTETGIVKDIYMDLSLASLHAAVHDLQQICAAG